MRGKAEKREELWAIAAARNGISIRNQMVEASHRTTMLEAFAVPFSRLLEASGAICGRT
jgi:hypothetical protein